MPVYWYAGLKRDSRKALLAGPFSTETEAAALVEPMREAAEEIDPFCCFDSAGVFRVETDKPAPAGKLNTRLGVKTQKGREQ